MIVYIIHSYYDYETGDIIAVFSTKEKAEEYIKSLGNLDKYGPNCVIISMEVDKDEE